jgi:hypothetical protein
MILIASVRCAFLLSSVHIGTTGGSSLHRDGGRVYISVSICLPRRALKTCTMIRRRWYESCIVTEGLDLFLRCQPEVFPKMRPAQPLHQSPGARPARGGRDTVRCGSPPRRSVGLQVAARQGRLPREEIDVRDDVR